MPTYEYRCKDCGETLEVVQSFTDDALTTCPACGGTLKKVFGNVGIAFKGSGFYKTDTRSGSSKSTKSGNGSHGSGGSSNGDGGSSSSDSGSSSGGDGSSSTKSDASSSSSTSAAGAGSSSTSSSSSSD